MFTKYIFCLKLRIFYLKKKKKTVGHFLLQNDRKRENHFRQNKTIELICIKS